SARDADYEATDHRRARQNEGDDHTIEKRLPGRKDVAELEAVFHPGLSGTVAVLIPALRKWSSSERCASAAFDREVQARCGSHLVSSFRYEATSHRESGRERDRPRGLLGAGPGKGPRYPRTPRAGRG